ncbi:hypothetical protein CK203_109767 [Vitis vinifera]|uniref:Uncharacterized protein n=1 Tax=Vitis vinifera TaxID=29760 RepID=A0A438DLK9_VITVI|nr:hypothetical protein CK203_109767 [Vitis vinifera]
MEEEMFCYIPEDGELVKIVVGSVEYKGGGAGFIALTSAPTPIVVSNSAHVSSIGEPPLQHI